MYQTFSGAGLQKNHSVRDCNKGGSIKQQLPEYISRQGRCAYRACGVYVRKPVCRGESRNGSPGLAPAYIYAVETAIQLTLTELNENLREIYIEAYTHHETSVYIFKETAKELYRIFGAYQPELTCQDFYSLEIGTAGIMYSYMAYPCDEHITLEKKIESFLLISLSAYKVPEQEQREIIGFIRGLDIRKISEKIMHKLFEAVAMHFEFKL